tara:strand:+ start:406 stop:705 length:300 start_codon:yes stop_codon:yes gene_type:complete
MTKRRIITIEEFFRLKEMFDGLPEDQGIACEIYRSQYQDREIIDQLMAKALIFENRKKFIDAVVFKFKVGTAISLYNFIDIEEIDSVYTEILNKIMKDD